MDALKIEKADPRRLRLGRADRRHHRGALAGTLQGAGLRERLPDRQPAGRQGAAAAGGRARSGGTSSTSPPSAAAPATSKYRHDFAKLIWQLASPKWKFDDATFDRSAAAFDNPDHVAIVIHNYRWRLGLAEGEAKYDDLEKRLAAGPVITVPTITLEGDANGAPHPEPAPTPGSSPASTRIDSSRAASATTCRRKPRRPLPTRSLPWINSDAARFRAVHDSRMRLIRFAKKR